MTDTLPDVAPLGLEAEPELWIIVDAEGNPFECVKDPDGTLWVIAARNEADVLRTWSALPIDPTVRPSSGRAAMTTEVSLRRAIECNPRPELRGWVIFDSNAVAVREESVR